jgi:hypothetical protein
VKLVVADEQPQVNLRMRRSPAGSWNNFASGCKKG